jgi:hypothetical protein
MMQAEAQNCALVKSIADDAISWIYAPVTTGHVGPDQPTQEAESEVDKGKSTEVPNWGHEVSGDDGGSGDIVIDDEIVMEEEMGDWPESLLQDPHRSHQTDDRGPNPQGKLKESSQLSS